MILDHHKLLEETGDLKKLRTTQNVDWFQEQISQSLVARIFENNEYVKLKDQLVQKVLSDKLNPKEGPSADI